ncbi:hypothetical protein [Serratia sp. UGAL515B_01]|uniref:hypothetical protein n=1 Tax=Serratia sp. UGAL515B_01 TaxID=2986763 RepID=UPI002954EEC9|nr:hypothetical protein [Serratia sp. UGAL515B_01]WON78041.1 hypothetical protein OK023_05040 [Serratia sp. UGAL515B_01]
MLKKVLVIIIALCALSSLGGVFLAGLNIYTRSTTPQQETTTTSDTSTNSEPADTTHDYSEQENQVSGP